MFHPTIFLLTVVNKKTHTAWKRSLMSFHWTISCFFSVLYQYLVPIFHWIHLLGCSVAFIQISIFHLMPHSLPPPPFYYFLITGSYLQGDFNSMQLFLNKRSTTILFQCKIRQILHSAVLCVICAIFFAYPDELLMYSIDKTQNRVDYFLYGGLLRGIKSYRNLAYLPVMLISVVYQLW